MSPAVVEELLQVIQQGVAAIRLARNEGLQSLLNVTHLRFRREGLHPGCEPSLLTFGTPLPCLQSSLALSNRMNHAGTAAQCGLGLFYRCPHLCKVRGLGRRQRLGHDTSRTSGTAKQSPARTVESPESTGLVLPTTWLPAAVPPPPPRGAAASPVRSPQPGMGKKRKALPETVEPPAPNRCGFGKRGLGEEHILRSLFDGQKDEEIRRDKTRQNSCPSLETTAQAGRNTIC